jgi:hypothetical protein
MGFLGLGKKKGNEAEEADQPAAKQAPAAKRQAPSEAATTDRRNRQSRRVVAAKPAGTQRVTAPGIKNAAAAKAEPAPAPVESPDELDLASSVTEPSGTTGSPSTKPQYSGNIATANRVAGPCRTGDAALLTFLKEKTAFLDAEKAGVMEAKAQREGLALDAAGVALSYFTEDQLVNALTQECWVPHLKVDKYEIRKKALDTVAQEDAVHYGVFPVDKLGSLLTLAMVNPLDADTIRALESKTGLDIKKVVATRSEVNQAIDRYYGGKVAARDTSISFTQDVEPRSVTQMMANVQPGAPGSGATTTASPAKSADLGGAPEIQDIDDLLTSDEAIAPAIIETVSAAEPLVIPPGEVVEIVEPSPSSALEARAQDELQLDDTAAVPDAKAPALEFDLDDDSGSRVAEPPIAPPTARQIKPKAPAAAKAPVTASRSRSVAPASGAQGVNLVPVMEEEFQHAITHGKAHVFEKWIGLQTRNRIINAVPVEAELEDSLAGLYATPRA